MSHQGIISVTDIPSNSDNDEEYREELKKNDLRCVPLDDIEILQIAGKRVEIIDSFRVMKTDMQIGQIYVRKPEHIKAHMLLVYLALTLICILKKKMVMDLLMKNYLIH